LAIAVVLAAVIISASAFSYSSFETTITRTSTVTIACPGSASNDTSAVVTDCHSGVTLQLSTDPAAAVGTNLTVFLSVTNDISAPNRVNFTGYPTLPDGLGLLNDSSTTDFLLPMTSGCGYYYLALLNASGEPMQLNDNSPLTTCDSVSGLSAGFNPSQTFSDNVSFGGYWTSPNPSKPWANATYSRLTAGNYTLVAFDPWGQLAELSLTLLPASFDYLTAACYYISYGNDTGGPCFANTGAYIFGCRAAAATLQGCTQDVTTTLAPYSSYAINIRYPFANQTTEQINKAGSWPVNCLLTLQGAVPEGLASQTYNYCIPIGENSFVVGEPGGAPFYSPLT
jgi:hypothetical protein